MENDNNEKPALYKTTVRRCFANSLPFYEYPIPEENRIKKLFYEFEIRKLGIKKVTDRIRKEMGAKFNCNRIESDWITEELKKPNKETQELIDLISNINCKVKVVKMKNSEKLRIEAQQEENDLVYLGKMKKVFREERFEKFETKWIEKLKQKGFEVENISDGKFLIRTTTKYGNIEYFPKANRIFIKLHAKQKNKGWYSKGLNWINERLLK